MTGKKLVRRLTEGQDVGSYGAHLAVLASPYRSSLLPFMEQRLTAPDQPVWERYLDTLARLAELVASGGPMQSYPKDAAGQKAWQEEAKRRAELRQRKAGRVRRAPGRGGVVEAGRSARGLARYAGESRHTGRSRAVLVPWRGELADRRFPQHPADDTKSAARLPLEHDPEPGDAAGAARTRRQSARREIGSADRGARVAPAIRAFARGSGGKSFWPKSGGR